MKTILAVLAIGVLLVGLWVANERVPNRSTPLPEISFNDLTGNTTVLSDLRGQPVLVAFWATTCALCIAEIPDLIQLAGYPDKCGKFQLPWFRPEFGCRS